LNREEAIGLIKEITEEKCTNIVGHDIILVTPKDETDSQGYELHIKTALDKVSSQCLELLVQSRGYVLKIDPKSKFIVVYKPKVPLKLDETGIM